MSKFISIAVGLLFVALSFGIAYAHCGACGTLEDGGEGVVITGVVKEMHMDHPGSVPDIEVEEGEIINDICPVMGGEVDNDTPYKVEYQDKLIGFCCPACVDTFNADPEKYMAKLKEMQSAEAGHEGMDHEGHMR